MTTLQEAASIEREIIEWRRFFHQHAEVGADLPVTSAKVCEVLDSLGVEYKRYCSSGVMAFIGKKGGKSILMRGDMDALPMKEQTGLDFASLNDGAMHSCGHDTHTAMLLGAAKILKAHESELDGLAILMFQPDEEGLSGAHAMIEAGALDNPKPDYAMALHISGRPLKTGELAMSYGAVAASSDCFKIVLHGKGGHGASPQEAVNPIFCAIKIIEAFTDIGRYEIDPQLPSVVNTCAINSGTIYNVIPNDCEIMGTMRMFNEEKRAEILSRLKEAVEKISSVYRCESAFTVDLSVPSMQSDEGCARMLHEMLSRDLDGVKVMPLVPAKMMGSEDFAWVTQKIPSVAMQLGSTPPVGQEYPGHHPKVMFDEASFKYGASTYAQCALSYLK